jgi:retinol dehydrogenase 14
VSDTPTYVVTGGSDGIGLECASRLLAAQPGCRLVLVGRSPARTSSAVERLRHEQPACEVDSFLCDFTDQQAVRRLGEDLLASCARIDVLVNNAGTVFARRTLTADGIEATFAVNHLAGVLLTELLLDRVRQSAPSRIVFTSSESHYTGTMDLDDLGFEHGYTVMRAYSRSKLANVLTARLLARRLEGTGVTVVSMHPGTLATNIWSNAPWFARPLLAVYKRLRMEDPAAGGARLAHLALSPDVAGRSGEYYHADSFREPSALARDDALGEQLYDVSVRLVGLDRPAA